MMKEIKFPHILQCPECSKELSFSENNSYSCASNHKFYFDDDILDLSSKSIAYPDIYNDSEYIKWTKISSELLEESYNQDSAIEKIQDYGHHWLENRNHSKQGLRLDLGCGFGRHFDFAEHKENLIGFDANIESLKKAKKNNSQSMFIKGNIESLPFRDKSFDEIVAVYSLEHIFNLTQAIIEIKRVLKKDAFLLVGLPAEGGLMYNLLRKMTTIPYFSKKYNLDYEKVVKIEHCNTASKVISNLKDNFSLMKTGYYPFFIKSIHFNLITMAIFKNDRK